MISIPVPSPVACGLCGQLLRHIVIGLKIDDERLCNQSFPCGCVTGVISSNVVTPRKRKSRAKVLVAAGE